MENRKRLGRLLAALLVMTALAPTASTPAGASASAFPKLDPLLQIRASLLLGRSRIVIRAVDATSLGLVVPLIQQLGGTLGRSLPIIDGYVAEVPNSALAILGCNPFVRHIALDRPAVGAMERTGSTVGATAVRQQLGYDGAGIGVAIVDSGVTPWHDDLTDAAGGAQRVERFVDFVGGRQAAYDDYGHGTHVAGIIAGNGFDSGGARSGIAPAARLIVLKALDSSGRGRISDVIAALDYVLAHKDALNIRVVNLSVATGVYESYNSDPLTVAARRVVAAGIVVVAAAGNNGRSPQGRTTYGGITAPGNAPWVLTIGASSHAGTVDRSDDAIAAFSSRGPSAIDNTAKPDLVAPGVGIESLSDPASAFYTTKAPYLLSGTVPTSYLPYLSQSGTSMAAPVVTGTVALMLQANPALKPNEVKAILQYTAQDYAGYNPLTQGAGFLNAHGAVALARFFAAPSTTPYPWSREWGERLIWGNYLVRGGRLMSGANAWGSNVTWGALSTPSGQTVEWGVICSSGNCDAGNGTWKPWGTMCADSTCSAVVWGDSHSKNVVWGSTCNGTNCRGQWSTGTVSGTDDGETVVWGTDDGGETVVWGTSCTDASCQPVVWDRR